MKPCPFCGGEPQVFRAFNETWLQCTRCSASSSMEQTDELALKQWDTRHEPTTTKPRKAAK